MYNASPRALSGHLPASAPHGFPLSSFEDGFLGLTQKELHEKMGPGCPGPQIRSAGLQYYAITDWDKYFRKLVSPENGEDVYTFKRDGVDVRYSFSYAVDPNEDSENRTLYVRLVDIEFSPAVPISQVPSLIPEFRPSIDPASPSFRSNIGSFFKGPASPQARFIVKEAARIPRLDTRLSVVFPARSSRPFDDKVGG